MTNNLFDLIPDDAPALGSFIYDSQDRRFRVDRVAVNVVTGSFRVEATHIPETIHRVFSPGEFSVSPPVTRE